MKKHWILVAFILTFFLAIIFSLIANFLGNFNNIVLIICILAVILVGIIFDIIGTSILSCDEKVFHSKASQKMKGAKMGIKLIKNSSTVASFCNDVVGDICGIISGSLVAILVVNIARSGEVSLWNVLMASLCSSLTVGCKAIGKRIAVKKSNEIISMVSQFLEIFARKK